MGFLDNPWSSTKDCCSTLVGIGKAAAKVAWMVSPLGMAWEFTFGDCYQGEIKAAVNTAKKAAAAVGTAYDFAKKWGPEVCTFLTNLIDQSAVEVQKALRGEIPKREEMGPEMQVAIECLTHLIIMADDAWVGMEDAYERGYWLGYIAFEVAAAVVAGVLTAPAGGAGGAALLARHVPKVTRIFGYVEKLLTKFDDIPAIRKVLDKLGDYFGVANILGDFCFAAGTPVLTARGHIPIDQIRENDWVWSRHEHTDAWGWRPVVKTFITHPQTLVHLRYVAQGGEADTTTQERLGQARQGVTAADGTTAEIICTRNHLIHARRKTGGVLATMFMAAGMLQAGDLLTLADGRDAAVQDLRVEQAQPGTTFTTYNFTVADHHTYFAGALPVWVHNKGLIKAVDDCGFLGERLNKIVRDNGNDSSRYFEYLKEARESISGTVRSDRIWGNGYKKMTQKMVDGFKAGDDVDKIPTYNQLKASRAGTANARKIKQADVDDHHIIPKSVVETLRDEFGSLPANFSLGNVPAVCLSKADHRKISDVMNPFLKSKEFRELETAAEKARAIVDWYDGKGYSGQAKVAFAWFQRRGIL